MFKKIIVSFIIPCLMISVFTFNVYAEDNVDGFQVSIRNNDQCATASVTDPAGHESLAIFNKNKKQLIVDGEVVEYSINQDGDMIKPKALFRSGSPWTPVCVAKGLHFSCSPAFKTAAFALSSLIAIMAGGPIAYFGKDVVKDIMGSLLNNYKPNPLEKVNLIYSYDWYRTSGAVKVPGATIATIASRYQNYRGKVTFMGKTVTKNTQKVGGWWTGQKPF